jgi:YggT family protein
MGFLGQLIMIVADAINMIFTFYIYIVVAAVLISWVNPDPYNPIVRFLRNATDPLLNRIRRVVPTQIGGFDFSPMLLLFGVYLLQRVVILLLTRLAYLF